MTHILEPTISGTNEQFSALRDSDDAANTFIAFVTFNEKVTPVFKDKSGDMQLVPCADVRDITEGDYSPSGLTAMRDGVNTMIDFLVGEAKKADDVLVVVISDGMENPRNASKTTSAELSSKVKELQDSGWNFTYIGANQDLTQVSADLGIHAGNMLTFDANAVSTRSMHRTVRGAVANYAATRHGMVSQGLEGRVTTQSLYDMPATPGLPTNEDPPEDAKDSDDGPITVLSTAGDGTTV
jgi:hypothetical protein